MDQQIMQIILAYTSQLNYIIQSGERRKEVHVPGHWQKYQIIAMSKKHLILNSRRWLKDYWY